MRKDILEKKEQILKWIENNESKGYMCRELDCKQDTLNAYLKKMGIEYAGNMALRGKQKGWSHTTFQTYIATSVSPCSSRIRKYLIRDGLKENKCEGCGLTEWRGKPLTIELHHVDGDKRNNDLSNLRMECPNCHSQTPNHSRQNRNKAQ